MGTKQEFKVAVQNAYEQGAPHPTIGPFLLKDQVLENETLNCLTFDRVEMEDTVFCYCDLRGAVFENCKFSHVIFYKCQLYGVSFPEGRQPTMIECSDFITTIMV